MTTSLRLPAVAALGAAALVALAACTGGTGPGWTYAPPTAAPVASGSPATSGSPAAGGSPAASAAPASAAPASAAPASAAPASAAPASAAPASAAPASAALASPGATPAGSPAAPGSPAASAAPGTTIELEETETLALLQNGQPVTQLNVKVGDTIDFKIDNTSDFDHTFFIGPAAALQADDEAGLPGLAAFQGTKDFTYTVTADTANLQFGCTLDGHYPTMHGSFVVTP